MSHFEINTIPPNLEYFEQTLKTFPKHAFQKWFSSYLWCIYARMNIDNIPALINFQDTILSLILLQWPSFPFNSYPQ